MILFPELTKTTFKLSTALVRHGEKIYHAKFALVGQGIAGQGCIRELARRNQLKDTIFIPGGTNWVQAMNPAHGTGQITKAGTPHEQRRTVQMLRDEDIKLNHEAFLQNDSLSGSILRGSVLRVSRDANKVVLVLNDTEQTKVVVDHALIMTNAGPERTLQTSGTKFMNAISKARAAQNEVTTVVKSFASRENYRNKRALVIGGGASGAWRVGGLIEDNASSYLWLSTNGFETADPTGQNSEIMKQSKDFRMIGRPIVLKYLKGADGADSCGGVEVIVEDERGRRSRYTVDRVVCALGNDPTASLGINSILSAEERQKFQLYTGEHNGVLAYSPDGKIIVSAPAMTDVPDVIKAIQGTYPKRPKDTQVLQGVEVARDSGTDAAAFAAEASKNDASS